MRSLCLKAIFYGCEYDQVWRHFLAGKLFEMLLFVFFSFCFMASCTWSGCVSLQLKGSTVLCPALLRSCCCFQNGLLSFGLLFSSSFFAVIHLGDVVKQTLSVSWMKMTLIDSDPSWTQWMQRQLSTSWENSDAFVPKFRRCFSSRLGTWVSLLIMDANTLLLNGLKRCWCTAWWCWILHNSGFHCSHQYVNKPKPRNTTKHESSQVNFQSFQLHYTLSAVDVHFQSQLTCPFFLFPRSCLFSSTIFIVAEMQALLLFWNWPTAIVCHSGCDFSSRMHSVSWTKMLMDLGIETATGCPRRSPRTWTLRMQHQLSISWGDETFVLKSFTSW